MQLGTASFLANEEQLPGYLEISCVLRESSRAEIYEVVINRVATLFHCNDGAEVFDSRSGILTRPDLREYPAFPRREPISTRPREQTRN